MAKLKSKTLKLLVYVDREDFYNNKKLTFVREEGKPSIEVIQGDFDIGFKLVENAIRELTLMKSVARNIGALDISGAASSLLSRFENYLKMKQSSEKVYQKEMERGK